MPKPKHAGRVTAPSVKPRAANRYPLEEGNIMVPNNPAVTATAPAEIRPVVDIHWDSSGTFQARCNGCAYRGRWRPAYDQAIADAGTHTIHLINLAAGDTLTVASVEVQS